MTHAVSRRSPDKSSASNKDVQQPTVHTTDLRLPTFAASPPSLLPRSACLIVPSFSRTQRYPAQIPPESASQPGSSFKPLPQPFLLILDLLLSLPLDSTHTPSNMSNVPSRTATPSRDTGSHTIEQTRPNPVLRLSAPSGVLRLRAEPDERRHIQWAEDVIDNEGMGKKSSKGTRHSYFIRPPHYTWLCEKSRSTSMTHGTPVDRP